MLKKLISAFVASLFLISGAFAQSGVAVKQSGNVTAGHIPWWVTSGVIGDAGSAADSPITSIGATGPICSNSARQSAGGWNSLCIQAFTSSSATISLQNYGTAPAETLCFVVNGTSLCTSGSGGGQFVTAAIPTTAGVVTCWVNTVGLLGNCSAGAATLFGNPGATSGIPAPFTIQSLPARGAPDVNNDKIPLYDAAAGTIKYVTPGLIASSATSGVSSLCALTGALTAAQLATCVLPPLPYMLTNGEILVDTVNAFLTPYTANASFENWAIDGFRIYGAGGTPGTFAIQAVTNVSLNANLSNALWLRSGTRNTAPTAADNYHVEQWIIPSLLAPLQMGTASAQQFTWSIYMACSKTNLVWSWSFLPADNSRSFVGTVNYNTTVNVPQRVSITVPGDTFVTSAYAVNGMKIIMDLGFGSNFELPSASTVWGVGADFRVVGSYNFIQDATPPACFFSGEQLDLGSVALPLRPLGLDFHQRRAQMFKCTPNPSTVPTIAGQGFLGARTYVTQQAGANASSIQWDCPVQMNDTPVVNLLNPAVGGAAGKWGNLNTGNTNSGTAAVQVNTRSVTIVNAGDAADVKQQINGISFWLGACPGNIGVGTGCSLP